MRAYFLRRFLLIPPTLFGITVVVFLITRIVPGGPIEQAIMERQMGTQMEGRGSREAGQTTSLSQDQIDQLKKYYGFDKPWYASYALWLGKIASGDLGTSYRYNEPVWDLMKARFPVSLFYGFWTLIIAYGVCIPLGILKAIRHKTWIDTVSSIIIFVGYAVPGYVLGGFLVVFFAAHLRWFPMGGFVSENFSDLSPWGKASDLAWHAALPLICYLVGTFALATQLVKNHLLDNLASDYMRTAVAKGVSKRRAVLHHALRNSLIPIATSFGDNLSILLMGSFLIETIFDIDGFGLLGYNSLVDRDYPVVMGVLFVGSILLLIGNILSDFLVALVDPRVKFS